MYSIEDSMILIGCTMLGIAIGGVTGQMMFGLLGGVIVGVVAQGIVNNNKR
ncbi:MAG: hypothetical protein IKL92_01030 [Oscillospiraceae bacterium]|nr:hypothetical protein [Oscillospiraceae bacterium]